MQKKSFQLFQKEFFSNSTSFLLKKSYIPSNIAPFNYPGTLRVIGPGPGPGPGNGKSQKTGSGPGTPLLGISGYPGNSLPVAILNQGGDFIKMEVFSYFPSHFFDFFGEILVTNGSLAVPKGAWRSCKSFGTLLASFFFDFPPLKEHFFRNNFKIARF